MSITRVRSFKYAAQVSPKSYSNSPSVIQVQSQALPALRVPVDVLGFGSAEIVRISDESMLTEDLSNDDVVRRIWHRHEYSKEAAVRRGNDRIVMQVFGGTERGGYHDRTISTGAKNGGLLSNGGDLEFNAHPTNPDKALYNGGINPATYKEYTFSTQASVTKISPKDAGGTAYYRAYTGQEGRPSFAWDRIALMCRIGSDTGNVDVVVWDLNTDTVVGRRQNIRGYESATVQGSGNGYNVNDIIEGVGGTGSRKYRVRVASLTGGAGSGVSSISFVPGDGFSTPGLYDTTPSNPDSTTAITGGGSGCTLNVTFGPYLPNAVMISPSGQYVCVIAASGGTKEYSEIWNVDSTLTYRNDSHVQPSHEDWVRGSDGEDYNVYFSTNGLQVIETSPAHQGIVRSKASDGVKTLVVDQQNLGCTGWGLHVSGICSYDHPGWCVVSAEVLQNSTHQLYTGEIFALNIHTGKINRICHHHQHYPRRYFSSFQGSGIQAGGSGYATNNILTAVAGNFDVVDGYAATFRVTSVDGGGAVTGIAVETQGRYRVTPSNPVATSGGAGTGCTLNVNWTNYSAPYWGETQAVACWGGDEIVFASWWDSDDRQGPTSKKLSGISRSGTTVTVTDAGHGRSNGNTVYLMEPDPIALVDGKSQDSTGRGYACAITVTDPDHFTYQTSTSGTISGGFAYESGRGIWLNLDCYLVRPKAGATSFFE